MSEQDTTQKEAKAEALVDLYNAAKPDHCPELEWFGMGLNHDTGQELFVLESPRYINREGLEAIREAGRSVRYVEAYEFEGEIAVQIEVRVQGEIPTND